MSWIEKIKIPVIIFLVSVSMLMAIEAALGFYFKKPSTLVKEPPPIIDSFTKSACFKAFNPINPKLRRDIYLQSWSAPYTFKFDGFHLEDNVSEYHNVKSGIRRSCHSKGLEKSTTFFYGGSTMEGVGIKDCDTIPSHYALKSKRDNIVNYGVRGDFSIFEFEFAVFSNTEILVTPSTKSATSSPNSFFMVS